MSNSLLLLLIIFLPFFGSLFVLNSKNSEYNGFKNAFDVSILTVLVNIFLTVTFFSVSNVTSDSVLSLLSFHIGLVKEYRISFGVDILSLIFVLGLQIAVFIGILGIRQEQQNQKSVLFWTLLYTSFLNAYFFAEDVLSFYICFTAMLLPLYMMTGFCISKHQHGIIDRMMLHSLLGAVLLFGSCVYILQSGIDNASVENLSNISFGYQKSILVWGGLFMALVLRLPIWPFHYAVFSVSNALKNPLVFIALHLLPLSAVYAFMRFWPLNIPVEIELLSPLFQGLCVLTMIFSAFSGYAYTDTNYKIYHYVCVYELLYLLAVFIPIDTIRLNIAYSVFSFMIVSSALAVLQGHMVRESQRATSGIRGILCYMPRTSASYLIFVLAAVGLPISAFFWNNFIIIAEMFNFGLYTGTFVVISITIAALSMLKSLYVLEDQSCLTSKDNLKIKDIDVLTFAVLNLAMLILFLSFIKPLWFVF